MIICGIYKIENLINHHKYIGQSVNIISRWREHRTSAQDENQTNSLYQAIRKYGLENFSFEILEECSRDLLDEREKYWIKFYNSYFDGYNETIGGQGSAWSSCKLTYDQVKEIQQELISTSKTNLEIGLKFQVSENTISGINTGYYWKDDNLIYPIRQPIQIFCANCGKTLNTKTISGLCKECWNKEHRKVINRPSKEELKALLIETKGAFTLIGQKYGVRDNTIRKWCQTYNLPTHSSDYREIKKIRQPLIIKSVAKIDIKTQEILETYPSISEAERQNHCSHIGQVCSGKRKSAGGYYWCYTE